MGMTRTEKSLGALLVIAAIALLVLFAYLPRPVQTAPPVVTPEDYGGGVYYFKIPTGYGEHYLRSLAAFLKEHPTLECSDIHLNPPYHRAIMCYDTAIPAQDITEP